MYVHMYVFKYVSKYECMCVSMHAYMYVCLCKYVHSCVAYRQGHVLRNASLGDFVVVQTS